MAEQELLVHVILKQHNDTLSQLWKNLKRPFDNLDFDENDVNFRPGLSH